MIITFATHKTKTKKNQKDQKISELNHGWKTGMTEVHVLTYFQTSIDCKNSSIIFKWMLHHTFDHKLTFIHWHCYITYTCTYIACIDYFIIWCLQFAAVHVFHFYKSFLYCAIKTIELMTHQAVSFEKVFNWSKFLILKAKIYFPEMFHESLEKQFSLNLMLRYTMTLN